MATAEEMRADTPWAAKLFDRVDAWASACPGEAFLLPANSTARPFSLARLVKKYASTIGVAVEEVDSATYEAWRTERLLPATS